MKILLAHNRYRWAGGEDSVVRAEKALLEAYGHEVRMFEADNQEIRGVAGAARAAFSATWSFAARRRMVEALARFQPDVVHVHNFFPLLSPSIYDACRDAGVPVVQTLHNYRLLCPNAVFFRDGHACEDCLGRLVPWPGVLHACYQGGRMATAPIAAMLAFHRMRRTWIQKVDGFVVFSEFARLKFIEGGLPGDRLHVKPHFVHPVPEVEGGAGGYAMVVGRFSFEKGFETALDAWRLGKLGERLPLRIVGEGTIEPALRQRAAGVPGIEWMGAVPQTEVLRLMQHATCLIYPSVCYETFGMAIIEAFATGLPVIASGHGSMASLVRPGKTGLLFRPGDAADLAAKVEEFLAHPESHARMRAQARAEFEAKYTAEQNYRRMMEIYGEARGRLAEEVGKLRTEVRGNGKRSEV